MAGNSKGWSSRQSNRPWRLWDIRVGVSIYSRLTVRDVSGIPTGTFSKWISGRCSLNCMIGRTRPMTSSKTFMMQGTLSFTRNPTFSSRQGVVSNTPLSSWPRISLRFNFDKTTLNWAKTRLDSTVQDRTVQYQIAEHNTARKDQIDTLFFVLYIA